MMTDGLFLAGSVLVPLVFGLVPGCLPVRTHPAIRLSLWLAALGLAGWYGYEMSDAPASYRQIAWVSIGVSAILSLVVLVAETGIPRKRRIA